MLGDTFSDCNGYTRQGGQEVAATNVTSGGGGGGGCESPVSRALREVGVSYNINANLGFVLRTACLFGAEKCLASSSTSVESIRSTHLFALVHFSPKVRTSLGLVRRRVRGIVRGCEDRDLAAGGSVTEEAFLAVLKDQGILQQLG